MTFLDVFFFFWLRMVKHISTKIEWRPNSGSKLFSYVHFPKYPCKSEEYVSSRTTYGSNSLVDCDLWCYVANSLRE